MNYPQVITLKDGHNETLLSVRDFEYLVDKYMGFEALRYFRALREDYDSADLERDLAEMEYQRVLDENKTMAQLIDHQRQQIRELGGEPD